jgi:succinyl-CoA synthetase beta subunit
MDLLEYQAKELFREIGIPVLPSQTIGEPRQLKQLQIRYPVVLKSQVRVGGRGKAGGIRFVGNTIDAIAAARAIFNLSIIGEYPEVILAEARYDAKQEFFLAIVLDSQLQRPILLGSNQGGMNVSSLLDNLQQVVVESEFSPFYARRLTLKMGLTGELIQSVSAIIEKMYRLFWEKDLDLIEINPLGISATGELMALDGKITVNDFALARHPEIFNLTANKNHRNLTQNHGRVASTNKPVLALDRFPNTEASFYEGLGERLFHKTQEQLEPIVPVSVNLPEEEPQWLDWREKKGNIAIICNSLDLALVTWDLISQSKGKPACCVAVSETTLPQHFPQILAKLEQLSGLKVIIVNILAESSISQDIAQIIRDYLQAKAQENLLSITFVLRLVEKPLNLLSEGLESSLYWTDSLEEAVAHAYTLVKVR